MKKPLILPLRTDEKETIEEKLLSISLIIAIVMTSLALLLDIYLDMNVTMLIIFLICWIFTLYFKNRFKWVMPLAFCVLIFLFLPYIWVTSNGSLGSIPYYSLLFVAVICVTTRNLQRRILVLSLMAVQLLLIGYDSYHLAGATTYSLIFLALHLTVLTTGIAILQSAYYSTFLEERRKNRTYSRAVEAQNQQLLYYMNTLEESNSELKSRRHDFNNHLSVIYSLAESTEYDKILDYTKKLIKSVEHYRNLVDIPYTTIRALLNYKLIMAQNKNIDLNVKIDVPKDLQINEFDIGIVLGNLLDNAIEALYEMKTENRYLRLNISYKMDYLIIQTENPFVHKVLYQNHEYISSKNDNKEHGYGLNNIKFIVEKYNGMMNIDYRDQVFLVDIALLVTGNKGDAH